MLHQHPLDALEVEDHPQIERWETGDGRVTPRPVVRGIGVATHLVGEKVHHGSWPPPPNPRVDRARRLHQPSIQSIKLRKSHPRAGPTIFGGRPTSASGLPNYSQR